MDDHTLSVLCAVGWALAALCAWWVWEIQAIAAPDAARAKVSEFWEAVRAVAESALIGALIVFIWLMLSRP